MGILKWFKNRKKNKKKYSDDEYIKSTFIHADFISMENTPLYYILFTFTDAYCKSAVEFLSSAYIKNVFIQSSNDKDTGELDEDGNEIIISTPKNYLLIAVSQSNIAQIISNIDISNSFVDELIKQIYDNNIKSKYFKQFIDDGIMYESLYTDKDLNENKNILKYNDLIYTDLPAILKLLPSEFNGYHLLNIFGFYNSGYDSLFLQLCNDPNKSSCVLTDDEITHVYNGVIKNPTRERLQKLIQPLYKIDWEDEDLIHGELSSSDVDELFKQQYDRFSAVKNDNTTYMDIDEVLSEDDPEYNNVQSNDIEDY